MDNDLSNNADDEILEAGSTSFPSPSASGGKVVSSSTPGPYNPGDTVTYDLTFNPVGGVGTLNVEDVFDPTYLTFVSSTVPETSVDPLSGVIYWEDIAIS